MQTKAALDFRLRPSLFLAASLGAMYGAAGLGLLALKLPWFAITPLLLGLLGAAVGSLRQALLRAPSALVALIRRSDGLVLCQSRAGYVRPARILPSTTLFPHLLVVCLELEGPDDGPWAESPFRAALPPWLAGQLRRRSMVILPDSLPAQELRQLRIWLRWQREPEQPAP